jgi:hypothetical protein
MNVDWPPVGISRSAKRENDKKSGVFLGSRKLRNIPDDNTVITAV